MPAASAMRASFRLSRQFPDQRSGTWVTARPDEQFAPNRPICSRLAPYMAMRSRIEASRTGTASLLTSFTAVALPARQKAYAIHAAFWNRAETTRKRRGLARLAFLVARRRHSLVLVHDRTPGGAVEIVVLAALERPQEGGEAQKAERHRHQVDQDFHDGSLRRFARSAFTVTRTDEPDMASAATRGVASPATAIGTAMAL